MKQLSLLVACLAIITASAQLNVKHQPKPIGPTAIKNGKVSAPPQSGTGVTVKEYKPFVMKAFVPNLGQFNGRDKKNNNIQYGMYNDGMQAYFHNGGLSYRLDKFIKETEEKEKEKKEKGKKEEIEKEFEQESEYVHMVWVGSNPNCKITSQGAVSSKFNYADPSTTGASNKYHNITGFEKITYQDLYPGIDVEYTFHPTVGIKYQLVVKPGADLSKVKMQYSSQLKIALDKAGDLHLTTDFGDFIDHAPSTTYYQNNPSQKIACSFVLNGNTVTFNAGNYDNTKTLVIDPWSVPPTGANNNTVYNALHDAAGNVYIHGGGGPFVIQKFSPAGVSLWTFNTTWSWYKGGFECDNAGNTYSTDGFSSGGRIKVSPAGAQLWNQTAGGFMEMWCLNLDCNQNRLYVLGHQGPSNTGQGQIGEINMGSGAMIGTNLIYMNELHSSCIDQQGNIYSLTTGLLLQGPPPSRFTRISPAMAPVYEVLAGYAITELGPTYALGGVMAFNGLCADHCYVYTTEGAVLDKRCKTNGNIVGTVPVPGGVFDSNAGLCVDSCGNVYVGSSTGVHKFDNSFTLLQSAPTTGTVYDVKLGLNGEIIAAGIGFVATINMGACIPVPCNQPPLSLTITHTDAGCGTFGTATATMVGGCQPYTYSWSNGQTTQTATNLNAGTYTVYASDGGLCGGNNQLQDTVTILNVGGNNPTVTSTQVNNLCFGGATGTITANPANGNAPYTYLWTPTGQTTQTATGLAAGSYTVVITDANGCTVQAVINITEPTQLIVSPANILPTTCGFNNGSASANAAGGTPGYTYLWSPGNMTSQNVSNLASGNYTVLVTDANGCTHDTVLTIAPSTPVLVTFNIDDSLGCAPVCVNFALNSPTATTYTWNFGDNGTSNLQNPNHCYTSPGSYQAAVIISDNMGCTASYLYPNLINVHPFPQAAFSANPIVTDIFNSQITFTDLSLGATSWTWNFADPLNSTSNQQNPQFTYEDTGTFCPVLMVENQYTCRDTTSICIEIRPEFTFYAPNAFTPNGDGKNDTWTPEGVGIDASTFELFVFDRWGNLIWKTTQWQQAWDGKANGGKEIAQIDVYVWKCRFKDSVFGKKHEYVGHVSLIK